MEYSKFFILDNGIATRYLTLTHDDDISRSDKKFYELIKKRKLIFTEDRGRVPGDLAIGSRVTLFFSGKFVNLLKKNKIKSFKAYPIKFKSKYGNKTKYYYLELSKKLLRRDDLAEGTNIYTWDKSRKIGIGKKGLYFDLSEWNGSDIFGIKGTLFYIVTKRLKDIIEKEGLKNVVFENVEDFVHSGWKPIKSHQTHQSKN